jgi:hypothetical protein
VLGIGNCAQAEQRFIERGQAGQVISTNIHVMKLEIHCDSCVEVKKFPCG